MPRPDAQDARELERLATALVAADPDGREGRSRCARARTLAEEVASRAAGSAAAGLAGACAACLRHIEAGEISPGLALPYLAASASTLADLLGGSRDGADGARAAEAARYELETLFPASGRPRPPPPGGPDVPVTSLRRGRD